jgi:hypothetical protein
MKPSTVEITERSNGAPVYVYALPLAWPSNRCHAAFWQHLL